MSEKTVKSKVRSTRGSKAKGSDYERELAKWLSEKLGIEARRALLSGGGRREGGTDVEGVPGVHIEAKRVELLNFREALRQAEKAVGAARVKTVPVVIARRNLEKTEDSVVTLRLKDWVAMYDAWRQAGVGVSAATILAAAGE